MFIRNAKMIVVLLLLFIATTAQAQYEVDATVEDNFQWPAGIRCAVSLSFDDARETQVDNGVPLLNKHGVKATFYVRPDRVKKRLEKWKQAAVDGHELANHTVNHPCTGNFAFTRQKALEDHTLAKMKAEMLACNAAIKELTGVTMKSFAYPCGQKFVGRGLDLRSYVPIVAEQFLSGRGWLDEHPNNPAFCDLAQLMGMKSDQLTFEELKRLVDDTAEEGFWMVFAGHDIGPKRSGLNTTDTELDKLCRYMMDPANGIWVGTVGEISEYVVKQRSKNSK
jgi:peptidoglycan-N-acetylglucosamine deacetylase